MGQPSRSQETQTLLPGCTQNAQRWQPCGNAAASATQRQPGELGRKKPGRDSARTRKGSRRDSAGHATSRDGKAGTDGSNGSELATATAGTKWNRRAS